MDFLVDRHDFRKVRLASDGEPQAGDLDVNEILVRVDKFGFTANNVTYAVVGEAMRYWRFFPAPEGWGRIPVWGFADVTASRHEALEEGERIFGYLPMSTSVVLRPEQVSARGFLDGALHRRELPAAYQRYMRVSREPRHERRHEDHEALLYPLFFTSVLLEDFLSEGPLLGSDQVVFASASSRTALGTAFLLSRNPEAQVEVIGLTSPRNVTFCERTGYYDRVLPYDALESVPDGPATIFVDMAGDAGLRQAVHRHLGPALRHSCVVGISHWEARPAEDDGAPGPEPQPFFAPTQLEKRVGDWGQGGVEERFEAAWRPFRESVAGWLRIVRGDGPAAVERHYREVLEGRAKPDEGHILSLSEPAGV